MNVDQFRAIIISLAISGAILFPRLAMADYHTSDAIAVNVTGVIDADPCTVSIPDTIDLGEYARSALSVAGNHTPTVPFLIKMTHCPATTTKATLSFTGTPYPGYESYYYANTATTPAQNVGLQLFNQDGKTPVSLGNDMTYSIDIDSSTHEATLPVAARMYTPNGQVTAGNFTSVVTINIAWQ